MRVSYKGLNRVEYTPVFKLENATKDIDYIKYSDEAIHRLNNKRIVYSTIVGLHMHLSFE
jgi:hypothetical protein